MGRIVLHLTDPWTGRDVARDVTGLGRAQLARLRRVVRSAEFRQLETETPGADPAQMLAAWVERVGRERAGVALLRRRVSWTNAGAALGVLAGAFVLGWLVGAFLGLPRYIGLGGGDKNVIDLVRAYLGASAQLAGTIATWLVLLAFFTAPILIGVLLGAGAGWFAAGLIDAWEHARARRRARR